MNSEIPRQSETIYNENDAVSRPGRADYSWVPLLLLPIFFVIGWVANDTYNMSRNSATSQPIYGVGGGPGNTSVSPLPSATNYVLPPTTNTDQMNTQNPTMSGQPAATSAPATPRATAEESMSPSPSVTPRATAL